LGVLYSNNDRGAIEHIAVCLNLLIKSAKGVFVALDFISDEMTVDDGYVGPALAMLQPQFIHDEGAWGSMMLT